MTFVRKTTAAVGVLALTAGMSIVSPAFALDTGTAGPETQAHEIAMGDAYPNVKWEDNQHWVEHTKDGEVDHYDGAGWKYEAENAMSNQGWLSQKLNFGRIECDGQTEYCSGGQKVQVYNAWSPLEFDFFVNDTTPDTLEIEVASSSLGVSGYVIQTEDAAGKKGFPFKVNIFDKDGVNLNATGKRVDNWMSGTPFGNLGQRWDKALKISRLRVETPQVRGPFKVTIRGAVGGAGLAGLQLDYVKILTNAHDVVGAKTLAEHVKQAQDWINNLPIDRSALGQNASDAEVSAAATRAINALQPGVDAAQAILDDAAKRPTPGPLTPATEQAWVDAVNTFDEVWDRAVREALQKDRPAVQPEVLNDAIDAAQVAYNAMNVRADDDYYNDEDTFARANIKRAIDNAKAVVDRWNADPTKTDPKLTQGDIDAAAKILDVFVASEKAQAQGQNPTWDDANLAMQQAFTAASLSDADKAGKSEADIKIASDKIQAALDAANLWGTKGVNDGRPATIANMVQAKAMVDAIAAGAKADLAKTSAAPVVDPNAATPEQKAALQQAITDAEKSLEAAKAKTPPVKAEVIQALEDALDIAKKVAANDGASKSMVDGAAAALKDAQTAADVASGETNTAKPSQAQKDELQQAIDDAKKALEDAKNNGADQSVIDDLQKAIDDAQSTHDSPHSNVTDIENATKDVTKAAEEAANGGSTNPSGVVNKDALGQSIEAAKAFKDTVKDQANKDKVQKAIDAAQAVKNDTGATQGDVDAARVALDAAVQGVKDDIADKGAGKDPSKNVDKTDLEDSIKAAQDAKAGITGNESFDKDARDKIQAAIDAANAVKNKAGVTQGDIDAAEKALDAAVKGAQEDRSAAALDKAIKDAEKAKEEIRNGEGSQADKDEAIQKIDDAIEKAKEAAKDPNATQGDKDAAAGALDGAVDGAKKDLDEKTNGGDPAADPDPTLLDQSVTKAYNAKKAITGDSAAEKDARAKIQSAIDAANRVKNNPDSTQGDLDAAAKALDAAVKGAQTDLENAQQNPSTGDVAIDQAIKDANKAIEDIKNGPGTQADKDTAIKKIEDAIDAAEKVAKNPNSTEKDKAAAKDALDGAVKGAQDDLDAKNAGKDPSQNVQKGDLDQAIKDAEAARDAITGDSDADKAAKQKIQDAIDAAKKVQANGKATQGDVDAATKALDSAVDNAKAEHEAATGGGEKVDEVTFKRYAGKTRYVTANDATADHPVQGGVAFIATGENFPDALSIAPVVAKEKGALYLAHPKDGLSADTIDLIRKQDPSSVIVLGGTVAVPGSVTTQLKFLANKGVIFDRLSGADRYATSMAIAKKYFPRAKAGYLATGENFADALAVGSLAAKNQAPVLLVQGKQGLSAEQENLFRPGASITILGGPRIVDPSFETSIASNGWTRERLYGKDRYETAAKILAKYDANAKAVWMVTGEKFPDALVAASIAGNTGDPVVLTDGTKLNAAVAKELQRFTQAETRYAMGTERVVTDAIAKAGLSIK